MPADDAPQPDGAGKPCPLCGRPSVARFRPFCSRRCADVDLFRWLGGTYRIPTPPGSDADGDDGS